MCITYFQSSTKQEGIIFVDMEVWFSLVTAVMVSILGLSLFIMHSTNTRQRWIVRCEMLTQQLATCQEARKQADDKHLQLLETSAALRSTNEHLHSELEERKKVLVANEEQLALRFQALAQKLLEEKSTKFTALNKEQMESILRPLGDQLNTFGQEMARSHREAMDHKVALRTELERMHRLNMRMSEEAEQLTKAIKGDHRVQGYWGEFILESLLEKSGLVKGREYFVQVALKTKEGKHYRPDVVIKLPEHKSVVIDAKLSLVAYERYYRAESQEERALHLKAHLSAIRNHVKVLHEKDYAQHYDVKGLDFVLMFIPLEPAFALTLQGDSQLFDQAYSKGILLVSPATLMATLRTISYMWKSEYQNRHALEIAQQGGALYDKFVGFVEDLKKIGAELTTAQQAYEGALNKLSDGKGNLIGRAERIRALGVRTTKQLGSPRL